MPTQLITRNSDEIFDTPSHYDESGFHAQVAVLKAILTKAKRPMNQRELKDAMKQHYSGRYNILDLLSFVDVVEVGVAPVKYQLTEKLPVRQYTDAEKRAYWNSTFKRGEKLYFPFAK